MLEAVFDGEEEAAKTNHLHSRPSRPTTVSLQLSRELFLYHIRPAHWTPLSAPPTHLTNTAHLFLAGPVNVANCGRRLHLALLCFHFLPLLHVFEYIYRYTSFTESLFVALVALF